MLIQHHFFNISGKLWGHFMACFALAASSAGGEVP